VALRLKRLGITRVRPLAGGFEAWRAGGHPLEPFPAVAIETGPVSRNVGAA
jgi:3-mercaptopyruvate sulfurtransferase SseA